MDWFNGYCDNHGRKVEGVMDESARNDADRTSIAIIVERQQKIRWNLSAGVQTKVSL